MAHATIREGVGKLRGFPWDRQKAEEGRGSGMGFEHVGDACGSVTLVGAQLRKIRLGLIGDGGVAAKLRAGTRRWSLLGQEAQELVRVASFHLLRQTQEYVLRHLVGPKD